MFEEKGKSSKVVLISIDVIIDTTRTVESSIHIKRFLAPSSIGDVHATPPFQTLDRKLFTGRCCHGPRFGWNGDLIFAFHAEGVGLLHVAGHGASPFVLHVDGYPRGRRDFAFRDEGNTGFATGGDFQGDTAANQGS